MEPLIGGLAQFRGEFQVIMSAHCARMAKIGSQMRQFGLHVHPLGVPVLQHQNSATVPKIMKTRRVPSGIEDLGADA